MATGKRYYWIKLKESFMTSDTVDFMMSQPNGANYVVLYQMLCLKTINTNGRLSRTIGEVIIPYDIDKITRDCKWFSADTVRVAFTLYKKFGLIYEDTDGVLQLSNYDNMVGTETNWAIQKRNQKSAKLLPDASGKKVETEVEIFHPDIRDKDIRDKRLDNRDKDKEKDIEEEYKYLLPLNDNTTFGVTESYISELQNLYRAVDIEAEIRKMIGWCDANPAKRKTKRGIKAFINSWLSRAQDSGGHKNAESRRDTSYYGAVGKEV